MTEFRLPGLTHRTAILGRTGSGKTRQALWLLSMAPFDKQPYIVIDYKHERFFDRSDRIKEIGLKETPKSPGVYLLRPMPDDDIESFLWRIWEKENAGIYVDEGYGIDPRSAALQAVLTQGRSKHLPVIYLSQRPSWISRFVLSEADFFSCFPLNDKFDRQRIQALTPADRMNLNNRLPDYHSYWYDVGKDTVFVMKPVPDDEIILDTLETRLAPKRRHL